MKCHFIESAGDMFRSAPAYWISLLLIAVVFTGILFALRKKND
jgi:hypothetical protein